MSNRVGVHTVVVTGSEKAGSGSIATALSDIAGMAVQAQSGVPDNIEGYDAAVVVDAPPASDGVGCFERIRAREEWLPVVLVGLDSDPERVQAALEAGVTEYVVWAEESAETLAARLRAHVTAPYLDGAAQAGRWESLVRALVHDAKNPLNVVSGRMELLDVEATHADAIHRSLARVEAMLDEVSAVATFAGPISEPESVPLADVATAVWSQLTTPAATLTVETDRTVEANREGVEAILTRLFENAVQHGGEGVSVVLGDTGDGFYVADDGPGIDADEHASVFEQGYGTARDGEGYGLFVADRIAAAQGWDLTVGTSESGGARFEIHPR